MSVFVIRAFVRLREVVSEHRHLAKRVSAVEAHLAHHDDSIRALLKAINRIISPESPPKKRRIGFDPDRE
jgi:hypothetical protein